MPKGTIVKYLFAFFSILRFLVIANTTEEIAREWKKKINATNQKIWDSYYTILVIVLLGVRTRSILVKF